MNLPKITQCVRVGRGHGGLLFSGLLFSPWCEIVRKGKCTVIKEKQPNAKILKNVFVFLNSNDYFGL